MDAVLAAVPQQGLEPGGVLGGRDNQDILDAGQHQGGQRVINHGLVVDRQQLFAGDHGQRIKPGAGAAGENNAFHLVHSFLNVKSCAAPRRPPAMRRGPSDHKAEAASAVNKGKKARPSRAGKRVSFYFTLPGAKKQHETAFFTTGTPTCGSSGKGCGPARSWGPGCGGRPGATGAPPRTGAPATPGPAGAFSGSGRRPPGAKLDLPGFG